ncbi:SDR family oxidoreductase [Thermodesulfobacteriota bacterium]
MRMIKDLKPRTLITGATGFLGRNILHRLLAEHEDERFVLLVRGDERGSPRQRLHRILESRYEESRAEAFKKRIDLVPGDITWEHFGMDDRGYEALAGSVDRIIHSAASVVFNHPLKQARTINVKGTETILDFAESCHAKGLLKRLDYIGTAYVAGDRSGLILEDELDKGQSFHNTYEQTKFEAERLVRERMQGLPVTIYRPSIIVGDSRTGRTSSFNVMYFPLKIYARGIWRWIPGNPGAKVDIIPVDYICAALDHISSLEETIGKCYHLTASGRASTMGTLTKMAADYFGAKPVRFFNPTLYMNTIHLTVKNAVRAHRRLYNMLINKGELYLPYFMQNLEFDNRNARSILERFDLKAPLVNDYFSNIFQYCIDTDWGKNVAVKGD